MKILISPTTFEEAEIVAKSRADILDIKNVKEGSLGAQLPLLTQKIVNMTRVYEKECSATLGDLPYKPGTAALAALGMTKCGVDYIKAGLFGPKKFSEAFNMLVAIVDTVKAHSNSIKIVAAGYADWRKFDGLSPFELIEAANKAGVDIVMVDTSEKDGSNLFDNMNYEEIEDFLEYAKNCHLQVGLAGSLNKSHLPDLFRLNPDIIGVRGAVCDMENRKAGISAVALSSFLHAANQKLT